MQQLHAQFTKTNPETLTDCENAELRALLSIRSPTLQTPNLYVGWISVSSLCYLGTFFSCVILRLWVHLLFMFFLFVDSHVKEFLSSKMWQATRTGTIERWKAPLPAFTKAPLQQPPAAWCMNGELRCACCNWFLSKFHSTKPPPSPQVNIQISPPCQQSKTRLRNMTDKLVLVMLASFSLGDVHVHTCVDLKIAHRCELRKRA